MSGRLGKWILGLIYIFAVAAIWIVASFVVQSVVDGGVSPFLVTYICNSLFVVYIPLVEIGRYFEDKFGSLLFWKNRKESELQGSGESEEAILLEEDGDGVQAVNLTIEVEQNEITRHVEEVLSGEVNICENDKVGLDEKGRWTRTRIAKVSLLICPFWFLAQLTFNLSLKYTTVTSNTILSSASTLYTFLLSLIFLGEQFTWVKLIGVLLCMGGTIIVSLGDSEAGSSKVALNPALGDILCIVSAGFYAIYISLIRKKLPDNEDGKQGNPSMAQFLGFVGLFNLLIFLPIALLVSITKLEHFDNLTGKQFGLIIGKGLLDNVLSDYLWAKAVLLTTTTVATAGLTIQVPLAAIVDALMGNAPSVSDYIGAAAIMVGFIAINIPSDVCSRSKEESTIELNNETHQTTQT